MNNTQGNSMPPTPSPETPTMLHTLSLGYPFAPRVVPPAGMSECWRVIPDLGGLYEASDSGHVRRVGGRIMAQHDLDGYRRVWTSVGGTTRRIRVHRAVLMAFVPRPADRDYVDHINGVRHDNRLENLRWVTASENTLAERRRNGGRPNFRGLAHWRAKLNPVQVRILRACRRMGIPRSKWLSDAFGVRGCTAYDAACGLSFVDIQSGGPLL